MKTGRARRKESNPRCTVAPRLLFSLAPSVRRGKVPLEIASTANSNVKLDSRVNFSDTRRKALQTSPRLQSRAEIKTFSSFQADRPRSASLRSARAHGRAKPVLSALVKSFPRESYGVLTHTNGSASREWVILITSRSFVSVRPSFFAVQVV